MANVCAVRMIKEGRAFVRLLPHEPESGRYALNLVSQDQKHLVGSIGTFAVCKHCGDVYKVTED